MDHDSVMLCSETGEPTARDIDRDSVRLSRLYRETREQTHLETLAARYCVPLSNYLTIRAPDLPADHVALIVRVTFRRFREHLEAPGPLGHVAPWLYRTAGRLACELRPD
jgi:hypothetical protein